MRPQLIASSATIEGIIKLIVRYYYGSNVTLNEKGPDIWAVSTGKGECWGVRVIHKKARYRFENI